MTSYLWDVSILTVGWLLAQVAFHGYEAHVPLTKRVTKFLVLAALLMLVRWGLGRIYFFGLLGALTIGIGVLHGYWFHIKHGVHWRKAEPRETYYKLIGYKQNKENPKPQEKALPTAIQN